MPTLRQIRYFLTVADQGGFTPAAATLFVAQPALSRQIALLEAEIGFPLFRREPRGVSLTAAGSLFRERVAGMERSMLEAIEAGQQLDRGEAGVLRLLHSSSFPVDRLLPAIQHFVELAPGARVDLDRISSEQQVVDVANGKADVGIVRLPVLRRDPGVIFHELAAERLWVALPEGHPLAGRTVLELAELSAELFVSAVHRERGGLARRVTDLCLSRAFVPRLAPVISRKASMLALVGAGLGLAVVPEGMTRLGGQGIVFRPLADPDACAGSAVIVPLACSILGRKFADLAMARWAE